MKTLRGIIVAAIVLAGILVMVEMAGAAPAATVAGQCDSQGHGVDGDYCVEAVAVSGLGVHGEATTALLLVLVACLVGVVGFLVWELLKEFGWGFVGAIAYVAGIGMGAVLVGSYWASVSPLLLVLPGLVIVVGPWLLVGAALGGAIWGVISVFQSLVQDSVRKELDRREKK